MVAWWEPTCLDVRFGQIANSEFIDDHEIVAGCRGGCSVAGVDTDRLEFTQRADAGHVGHLGAVVNHEADALAVRRTVNDEQRRLRFEVVVVLVGQRHRGHRRSVPRSRQSQNTPLTDVHATARAERVLSDASKATKQSVLLVSTPEYCRDPDRSGRYQRL